MKKEDLISEINKGNKKFLLGDGVVQELDTDGEEIWFVSEVSSRYGSRFFYKGYLGSFDNIVPLVEREDLKETA